MKNLIYVLFVLALLSLGCSSIIRDKFNTNKPKIRSYGDNEANGSPIVDPVEAQYRDQFAELIKHARLSILNGDRPEVERLFTDDYLGQYDDGDRTTKKDLLDRTKKDTKFISLEVLESKVESRDQANAALKCKVVGKFTDETQVYEGVYFFVNTKGYWQISGWKGLGYALDPK